MVKKFSFEFKLLLNPKIADLIILIKNLIMGQIVSLFHQLNLLIKNLGIILCLINQSIPKMSLESLCLKYLSAAFITNISYTNHCTAVAPSPTTDSCFVHFNSLNKTASVLLTVYLIIFYLKEYNDFYNVLYVFSFVVKL